jgi:multidrug efflux pump subunit AcrA (membrane-fusion protein)
MNLLQAIQKKLVSAKNAFFKYSLKKKIVISLIVLVVIGFIGFKLVGNKSQQPQYQTSPAESGTLITTVSASGNVSAGGTVNITTGVSGTVTQIYVKNGDPVIQGQKIADVALDRDSQQKQTQAWASYLSAQNQVNNAQTALYTLQSSMFTKWKAFTDKAENSTYQNPDGSANTSNRTLVDFSTTQDDWLAAEANYKNQQNSIAQAQASLTSAYYNYQLLASTITAPTAGVISNLTIAQGLPLTISSSSSSNSNSVTTQAVGTISLPEGGVQAIVDLAEIDAAKVTAGNKATLTLAAFPNKTFTGKVLILNTNGVVSSGVTTYPATIAFDTTEKNMYPNMAVDANIITNVKDNVILIPTAAVQTTNGASTVRILKNGKVSTVSVEIGDSNDTQTEITSGVNEGDEVVTSVINAKSTTTTSTTSPFSAFGGGGGGGAARALGR